jgi:CMP-N-acetylneuraminic acid synthetase
MTVLNTYIFQYQFCLQNKLYFRTHHRAFRMDRYMSDDVKLADKLGSWDWLLSLCELE